MSQYLRDERLKNLTLPFSALEGIDSLITEIANKANAPIIQQFPDVKDHFTKVLIRKYVVRFDGKGFELYDLKEVERYFRAAKKLERICFVAESIDGKRTISGKQIDLRFDALNADNCFLLVQDDDKDWMESAFLRIRDEVKRHSNKSWLFRNRWVETLCQLFVALTIFLISIWAAVVASPRVKIDYAPLFIFLAVFLIFSHLWNIIMGGIFGIRECLYPNISFKEPDKLHWLVQTLVGGALIYLIAKMFSRIAPYFIDVFHRII